MKRTFRIGFGLRAGLLAGMMFWSVWASAQNTNAPTTPLSAKAESLGRDVSFALTNENGDLTFGLHRLPLLQREFPAGTRLWLYPASLIYLLLALAVSKLIDYLIRSGLRSWARRTKAELDDAVVALLDGPIIVVCFVVLLHAGLQVLPWPPWIENFLSKGLTIAVALSITYMATKFVDLLMSYWRTKGAADTDKSFDEHLFPIIRNSLKAFLVVVAFLLTAQNMGLNITSLIASLSIGGLAVGLAAQDTLANIFGAVSVLVDKPFRAGDRIKLDAIDGTVETIGLRSTRIRSLDGHLITVPNKTIGGAVITNITRRRRIKTEMNIGVTYDTPVEKLKRAVEIIEGVYKSHPMTAELTVSFNKFADSALNIQVVHFWTGTDQPAQLTGMQELNFKLKERFDQEKIEFAFPSQTIYVKSDADSRLNEPSRVPKAG